MRTRLFNLIILGFLLAVSALVSGSVMAQETMPTFSELSDGWNMLSPGGDTLCALGDPYHFFARPGSENRFLIFFQGGGACFDEATCSSAITDPAHAIYDSTVSRTEYVNDSGGILDFGNAENPFQDYNMIFIPYCTGDLHAGDSVATYGEDENAFRINHKGYVNATAALEWIYANFEAPESIFLNGCSAGAPGSVFHAPNIMAHYSGVPVAQMGDSDGFTRGGSVPVTRWGMLDTLPDLPEFEGVTASELTTQMLYIVAAAHYPGNIFSQVNTAHDEVQWGGPEENLQPNLNEIETSAPNFRSYTGWGVAHCLTINPVLFYTHRTNGVRLLEWVAELAAGEDVENVQCTDCETPELYEG